VRRYCVRREGSSVGVVWWVCRRALGLRVGSRGNGGGAAGGGFM
jgi:hypothetical protein